MTVVTVVIVVEVDFVKKLPLEYLMGTKPAFATVVTVVTVVIKKKFTKTNLQKDFFQKN